jgi:hypothetical protein
MSVDISRQMKRVGETRWSSTMKAAIGEHAQPKLDSLRDFQPVKFTGVRSDVV